MRHGFVSEAEALAITGQTAAEFWQQIMLVEIGHGVLLAIRGDMDDHLIPAEVAYAIAEGRVGVVAKMVKRTRAALDEAHEDPCVYALWSPDTNLIKIGFSTKIRNRVSSIRVASPVPLELLGTWSGTKLDEHRAHRELAEYRSHGEWFRLEPGVIAYLSRMGVTVPNRE